MAGRKKRKRVRRKGKPFMLYLSEGLAREIAVISRDRHIAKAELVRFAVDRLVAQLRGGQLDLPLGLGSEDLSHA